MTQPKPLLEVFTGNKRKKGVNRAARGKGAKAEALLLTQLTDKGYEVRRTHLSAYPDVIAWNNTHVLLIEVKMRSSPTGVIQAKSAFKSAAKTLQFVPNNASVLCYVRLKDQWKAFNWDGLKAKEIDSIV